MYDSFHLLWEKEKNEGIPFWQIVMEEDMSEQNISKEDKKWRRFNAKRLILFC